MTNRSLPRRLLRRAARVARRRAGGRRQALLKLLPAGSLGAEVGVWKGDFSAMVLQVVQPQQLHLIDPWHHQESQSYDDTWYGARLPGGQESMDQIHSDVLARFQGEIDRGQVVVHRANSLEAAATFPDYYFDWVYIDGDHHYAFVRSDLFAFLPKVKSGGLICGDDYHKRGWWGDGVVRAVNEFAEQVGCPLSKRLDGQFALFLPRGLEAGPPSREP
jgi:hypothetical protein